MKALVKVYMDQLAIIDFGIDGSLKLSLIDLIKTFCELKSHEYIENRFIVEQLNERLKQLNVPNQVTCNCHSDSCLTEVLRLLHDGFTNTYESVSEQESFGTKLQKAVDEFTVNFIPHMQEEEDVFQPLLIKFFAYDELCSLRKLVIKQHELWKQNLMAADSKSNHLFTFLSYLATEVVDSCMLGSGEELNGALQALVKFACDRQTKQNEENRVPDTIHFSELPHETMIKIFTYLSPLDRTRCAQVSKSWNMLTYSPELWRDIFPTNWAKGYYDFHFHDPCSLLEAESLELRRERFSDFHEENLLEARRAMRVYEQLTIFILPRIGSGVRRLVVAGGLHLTSQMLRSMLILCPKLSYVDASYCTNITDSSFKGYDVKLSSQSVA